MRTSLLTYLRYALLAALLLSFGGDTLAQNSKKVKDLKAQQSRLQKDLKKSKQDLAKTGKEVKSGQTYLHYIYQQLDERLSHIRKMESEMDSLEKDIKSLNSNIATLGQQLAEKKQKYIRAIRFAALFPKVHNTWIFVFSAKNLTQMYRRVRYAREYAVYQHNLGMQIQQKQSELMEAQNSLLASKSRMVGLLQEVMRQRRKLNDQQVRQQQYVKNLKKKEDDLRSSVEKKQKELNSLNKKIDELIAYEIEQARKKAEAEARRKAEEAKRKAEAEKRRKAAAEKSKATSGKSSSGKSSSSETTTSNKKTSSSSWLTAEDKKLEGTFVQNKGKLPVPITGQYRISGRFGTYNVPGLKNVTLDNKGVNYVGKPGARARCVFDGEVTAIFQFSGTKNVLVRHGTYISVYCNLSSVIVKKGQKLKARDIIGTVASDESDNCVLHFQLRKETTKLNPELWIGR